MKIRTNLAASEMHKIASEVGVTFSRFGQAKSRTHASAYDVVLSGSGRRRNCEGDQGATWDEWGNFLGRIYLVDPTTGTSVYRNAEHFGWSTANRYAGGVVSGTPCADHKWDYQGETPTHSYMTYECTKCGALKRYASRDYIVDNFLS